MIVPENLTLEELIGALKVEIGRQDVPVDEMLGLAGHLNSLEVIKRELDKKADRAGEKTPEHGVVNTSIFAVHGDLREAYLYLKDKFEDKESK